MALVRCPECGKEVSDKAFSCPACGYTIQEEVKRLREQCWRDEIINEIESSGYNEKKMISLLNEEFNKDELVDTKIEILIQIIEKYNKDSLTSKIWRWSVQQYQSLKQGIMVYQENMKIADKLVVGDHKYYKLEDSKMPVYDLFAKIEIRKAFRYLPMRDYIEDILLVILEEEKDDFLEKASSFGTFLYIADRCKTKNVFTFGKYSTFGIHLADIYYVGEATVEKQVVDSCKLAQNQIAALGAHLTFEPSAPKKPMSTETSAITGAILGGTPGAIIGATIGSVKNQQYMEDYAYAQEVRESQEKKRIETMEALNNTPMKMGKVMRHYFSLQTFNMEVRFAIDEDDDICIRYEGKEISVNQLQKLISSVEIKLREIRSLERQEFLETNDYNEARKKEIEYEQEQERKRIEKERIEQEKIKEQKYQNALTLIENNNESDYRRAKNILFEIDETGEWKESEEKIALCEKKIAEYEQVREQEKKKKRLKIIAVLAVILSIGMLIIAYPEISYQRQQAKEEEFKRQLVGTTWCTDGRPYSFKFTSTDELIIWRSTREREYTWDVNDDLQGFHFGNGAGSKQQQAIFIYENGEIVGIGYDGQAFYKE